MTNSARASAGWPAGEVTRADEARPVRPRVAPGDEDRGAGEPVRLEPPRDFEPVDVGELHVEQHDTRPQLPALLERLRTSRRLAHHLEAGVGEQRPHDLAEGRVIVNDQDRVAHGAIVAQPRVRVMRVSPG